MFIKRLLAYVIDYLIHSVLFTICSMIAAVSILTDLNPDAPFAILFLIYRPIGFIINCRVEAYIPLIITTIICITVCQIIIYSLEEYLNNGQTIGKQILKIKVHIEDRSFKTIIIRNILKNISILLMGIPFISILFNRKSVPFYDTMLKAYVEDI